MKNKSPYIISRPQGSERNKRKHDIQKRTDVEWHDN